MGKTSTESKRKYNEKAYDRVTLNLPKGKKEEYQRHAFWQNESLNAFIKRAIERQIEEDELSNEQRESAQSNGKISKNAL